MPPPIRKSKRRPRRTKRVARRRKGSAFGLAGDLRAIMEAAVDAIIVINDGGEILAFSPAAEDMFGYAADEVIGTPVSRLMPEPYRSEHDGYMKRYQATGERRIIGNGREVEAERKSGERFPVWVSVGETSHWGRRRFVGILRDLTDQIAAEAERHALEARLEHVGRFSLMGEMAAGIAHEINQPLSAITNYSLAAKHLLERDAVNPEQLRTACSGIAREAERAGKVIANLRSFIDKQETAKESLDLNTVIHGALSFVTVDAKEAGVDVRTRFASGLPRIEGNAVQLQQVLLNLTRNAVDATDSSSGRRRLRRGRIEIFTSQSSPDTVEFRVSDNGPGVPPDLAEAIFHPFITTKAEGLGVGLAISRTIVEAHGGQLLYEENAEGGAAFTVSLPVGGEEKSF